MKYFIGVDIGTQGTKANIFSEKGENMMESFVSSKLIHLKDGGIEQDPDEILDSVVQCIKKLMKTTNINSEEVLAIGMDGQMAGVMGIDETFTPIGNYDSWLDTRCEDYIQLMKNHNEHRIISLTGAPVSYFHGPKILWRKHERPEEYKRINKFITITTYITGKMVGLTSENAYIDYTHLHFTGFADTKNKRWSDELLNEYSVERIKMPNIIKPYDVVGSLTKAFAEKMGLTERTKLIAGCGDTAATILGAGVIKSGFAVDIAGTASVFSCCVDEFNADVTYKTLLTMPSIIDGLYTQLAYIGGGGQCLEWFKNNIVKQVGLTFDDLSKEAEEANANDQLLFIPHFGGRTCPNNPNIRGSWLNMNWSHERGHLFMSIMESIAYEYHYYFDIIKKLLPGIEINKLIGVGGGAKSNIFNQVKADVLSCLYQPMKHKDTATLACAVMAGFGIGVYNSIEETIQSFVEEGDAVMPQDQNSLRYLSMYEKYIKTMDCLEQIYR